MTEYIGITGMILLLIAFIGNIIAKFNQDFFTYLILNILGGFLLTIYAVLIISIPFIILESIWTVFAVYKIFKVNTE